MKALVTGATGFVGSALVRELLSNFEEVKVLARPSSRMANLRGLDVETARGDLSDVASLRKAMVGCDRVYHCAALYSFGDKYEKYHRANALGTRNLLNVALQSNVNRVVHTSTAGVIGSAEKGRIVADEETVWNLADAKVGFLESKYIAEYECLRAVQRGLHVVIVNPTLAIGPCDGRPTPTGKLIVDLLNSRIRALPLAQINVVPVRDVALGHRLAMERGRVGERYLLANTNTDTRAVAELVARIGGVMPPKYSLPKPIAMLGAAATQAAFSILPWKSPLVVGAVKALSHKLHYDNSKSLRELGMRYTSWEDASAEAIRWFVKQGFVKGHYSRQLEQGQSK